MTKILSAQIAASVDAELRQRYGKDAEEMRKNCGFRQKHASRPRKKMRTRQKMRNAHFLYIQKAEPAFLYADSQAEYAVLAECAFKHEACQRPGVREMSVSV